MPNLLSAKKDLYFLEPVSLRKVWISIYYLWLYCSLSSSLQSIREKLVAHLPLATAVQVLDTCGLDTSKAELPLSLPSLHPSRGYSISVSRVVNLSQMLNSPQPQLWQCRGLHGAALPQAEQQKLFCLTEFTGHPVAAHLLPLLPFPGVQACLFLPGTPTASRRRQVTPGTSGKMWPCVSESRDRDPRQRYWESSFSCLHKGLLIVLFVGCFFLLLNIFKAQFLCPHLSCFSLKAGALIFTTLYRLFDLSWDTLGSIQKCRFVSY